MENFLVHAIINHMKQYHLPLIKVRFVVLWGIIIPSVWALYVTLIYNAPRGASLFNPNVPESIKMTISVINFLFSPIIAVVMPFVFWQRGGLDEAKKSNKNLIILSVCFFIITTVFHLYNLMQNWIP